MASITIRNLDPRTKARLRVRAAQHDRSMEEEAREILRAAVSTEGRSEPNLVESIRKLVEPIGGIDIELPKRDRGRPPPTFK